MKHIAWTLALMAVLGVCVAAQDDMAAAPASAEQMATEAAPAEPTTPAMSSREQAIDTLVQLREHIGNTMTAGYRGQIISEELIGGEMTRKQMNVWFRVQPRALRLEFITPDEGQVITWQQGWENMVVDRPWLPALNIDPNGERAMASSHRPVTQFGIDLTIDRYIEALNQTPEDGDVWVQHVGMEQAGREQLDRWDFHHPAVAGSPVTDFTLWLTDTAIPVHFENRAADGSRYERYRYIEFELNPSLPASLFED